MKTYGLVVFMVFAVVVSLINAQIEKDMIMQKRIDECFIEAKVPPELQQDNIEELLDNPKFKCFTACMMKKKGTMKNGKINTERQLAGIRVDSREIVKDIIRACSATANQQQNECEIAYGYIKCFVKHISVYQV